MLQVSPLRDDLKDKFAMPTLLPALNLEPRCLTRMFPASTNCPSARLTPSILGLLSPLRDDLKDKFAEMFETYYKELGCDEDCRHLVDEYIIPDLLSGLLTSLPTLSNLTVPSTSANRVSSLPMPTLLPALNLEPRCLTR